MRAPRGSVFDSELAPVGGDHLVDDRQTQTYASSRARPGVVEAGEALQDPFAVRFGDFRTVIADGEHRFASARL